MKRIDYAIFQLREDMEDNIPIRFANYSSLEEMGVTPTIDRYQEVYRGTLTELEDARSDSILEKLYEKFNLWPLKISGATDYPSVMLWSLTLTVKKPFIL